jgi:hypothetical protein
VRYRHYFCGVCAMVDPDFDEIDLSSITHDIAAHGKVQADCVTGADLSERDSFVVLANRHKERQEAIARHRFSEAWHAARADDSKWEYEQWEKRKAARRAEYECKQEAIRSDPDYRSSFYTGIKSVVHANLRNVLPDLTVEEFESMWERSHGGRLKLTRAGAAAWSINSGVDGEL